MKPLNIFKSDTTISVIISIGILLVFLTVSVFLWNDFNINFSSKLNAAKVGQFGDFIGGMVGSLWALAGVFLFYKALTEQREDFENNKKALDLQVEALQQQITEFKLNRDELVSSRKIYEEQNKTLKTQQFESNFYSLLNVYLKIKDSLNIDGNNFFKTISFELEKEYKSDHDIVIQHNNIISSYSNKFNEHREKLSHYFRSFYRIIKIIESNPHINDEGKTFYSKIMRSQLTDYELIILYYNSYTSAGSKTVKYILKYNLLKHVPIFSRPEFKKIAVKNKPDNKMLLFSNNLESFLSKHLQQHYELSSETEKIEEKFEGFNVIVGIYFTDLIKIKIYCDLDISNNGILLDEDEFNNFLCLFIYDRLIFNTYLNPDKVSLTKSKTVTEAQQEFCITIETDEMLIPNKDKY